MSGPTWCSWAVPLVAFGCVAVLIASVYIADHAQRQEVQRIAPGGRWRAGGALRSDAGAQSSGDEVPGAEGPGPQRQSGTDEELPPRTGDRERRIA